MQKTLLVKLHDKAKQISFTHKNIIQPAFKRIVPSGIGIDYFSLSIVDKKNTLSCYSSSPSLEFNLFNQDLWIHDGIYEISNHIDGIFRFWDALYSSQFQNTLKAEKQLKFGFLYGFYIMKKINDLFVIYSFATKSQTDRSIFQKSINTLTSIGDYFFNETKSLHTEYTSISNAEKFEISNYAKSLLKLVVNNSKKMS